MLGRIIVAFATGVLYAKNESMINGLVKKLFESIDSGITSVLNE